MEYLFYRYCDRRIVRVNLHDVSHHVPPLLRDRINAVGCVLRVGLRRTLLIAKQNVSVLVPLDTVVAYSRVFNHLYQFWPYCSMALLILFLTARLEEHLKCKSCHVRLVMSC